MKKPSSSEFGFFIIQFCYSLSNANSKIFNTIIFKLKKSKIMDKIENVRLKQADSRDKTMTSGFICCIILIEEQTETRKK